MSSKKNKFPIGISFFEKQGTNEFASFIKNNKKKTTKAVQYFLTGIKNEAVDTKEASRIIFKYVATQKISKAEEKHLKSQVFDVFKILGIGVPFVLIPGATILIPFIIKVAEKKGIDLYPSNFKSKDTSEVEKTKNK